MGVVSVIIPVYNAKKFLCRCLDSVLGQSYGDIEVVAVNDGSTDGSYDVLKSYAGNDGRLRIVNQANGGVAVARNTGLANATGEYVLFVDADDWIELHMVETLLSVLNNTPEADIAVCASDYAETPDEVRLDGVGQQEVWDSERQKQEFLTHQRLQGMLWNKLIRRSLFDGLSFDPTVGYGEDAQIIWKVLSHCRRMVLTDCVLYHHVIEPTSISNRRFSPRKYSAVKVWKEIEANVRNKYPKYLKLAQERLGFYAAYTLYEMYAAGYSDPVAEREFLEILRSRFWKIITAPTVSLKTKLFAMMTAVLPAASKGLLSKRT